MRTMGHGKETGSPVQWIRRVGKSVDPGERRDLPFPWSPHREERSCFVLPSSVYRPSETTGEERAAREAGPTGSSGLIPTTA